MKANDPMRSDFIRQLLGDGRIIKRCLDNLRDADDYLLCREISEGKYIAHEWISARVDGCDFDREACDSAENAIGALIGEYSSEFSDDDREDLALHISGDLHLVATALEYEVDHPFVTALWLSYRAGEFPTEPLEVDLPLGEVLDAGPAEARRLLDAARESRKQQVAEQQTEHDAFNDRIAAAARQLPDVRLLREILRQQRRSGLLDPADDRMLLAMSTAELPAGVRLPAAWRKLLRVQEAGEQPDWGPVWAGFEQLMPAAYTFLKKHCCGVAVATHPDRPPQLLYVYSFEDDRYSCGYNYSVYVGGPPLGARVPKRLREPYDMLPARLQEFYSRVHNGWCQFMAVEYGPLPLDQVVPLITLLDANNMPAIPVDSLWEVMRVLGGGRSLCLDVTTRENKRPKAVFVYPGDPPEPDLDFWKEYRHWLAEGLEINKLLPKG